MSGGGCKSQEVEGEGKAVVDLGMLASSTISLASRNARLGGGKGFKSIKSPIR